MRMYSENAVQRHVNARANKANKIKRDFKMGYLLVTEWGIWSYLIDFSEIIIC